MRKMARITRTPLSTEKHIRLIERENKLSFVIDKNATRDQVKREIEERFKTKVWKVNTLTDTKGRKRAYVSLLEEGAALDIATDLGLL